MDTKPRVILFLGPPGSGKGTQADRLSVALEIPAISTGELLRRESQSKTALGQELDAVLRSGQLVSDDQMNRIVGKRLSDRDCRDGCILDGFPRTLAQAHFLEELLIKLRLRKATVFDLTVSADELIARLAKRRHCPTCGRTYSLSGLPSPSRPFCQNDGSVLTARPDDQPSAIRKRLGLYQRNISSLVRHYQGRDYHKLCAAADPETIAVQILEKIGLGGLQRVSKTSGGAAAAATANFC